MAGWTAVSDELASDLPGRKKPPFLFLDGFASPETRTILEFESVKLLIRLSI
jgi:hypothetical protein